jgi:hypothetical protein
METEEIMSKLTGVVSHHEAEVAELRADRELAVEYLKAAMESLDNPIATSHNPGLAELGCLDETVFLRGFLFRDPA